MSMNKPSKALAKKPAVALVAAALWTLSGQAHAVSLSEIKLQSGLHQPFSATIPLRNFNPVEVDRVTVGIADDDIQRQYNNSTYLPNSLLAEIKTGPRGSYIHLTSATAVDEPFLKFAVQLRAPEGLILRQYEVLLDPPAHLYKPAPTGPLLASNSPRPRQRYEERTFKVTEAERASGVELVGQAPRQAALVPNPDNDTTVTPSRAPRELPQVTKLLDQAQTEAPAAAAQTDALVETQTLSLQEFARALQEYSLDSFQPQPAAPATPDRSDADVQGSAAPGAAAPDAAAPVAATTEIEAGTPERAAAEEAALVDTQSLTAEEFARALRDYSDDALEAKPAASGDTDDGRPQNLAAQAAKQRPAAASAPPTAALIEAPRAQPAQPQASAPAPRPASRRAAFVHGNADSVARALMRYREDLRNGVKTDVDPRQLMEMSAKGVKRLTDEPADGAE